jgi:tetratricopeptide (TPR) repeat protein
MNPDQTSASHLPAPLPSSTALFQRTQTALGLLQEVVQESSAEYWYKRGKAANTQEDWSEAEYSLEKCILLESKHWRGVLQLAVSLANKKLDSKQALIKAFDTSSTTIDDFGEELTSKQWEAIQTSLLHQYRVVEYFEPILRNFTNIDFDLLLGITITHLILSIKYNHCNNEYGEAEANLAILRYEINGQNIFDRKINYVHLWYRLSGLLYLKNNYSQAIHYFNIATKIVNFDFMALYHRADARHCLGDHEASLNDYDCAIDFHPNEPMLYLRRGNVREELNQYHEAISNYEHASILALINKDFSTYEAANEHQFYLREKMKDYKGALVNCEQIIASNPKSMHWLTQRHSIASKL